LRVLKLSYHPSNTSLGSRVIDLGLGDQVEVYISREDYSTLSRDGYLRLLEFCNIVVEREYRGYVEARFIGSGLEQAKKSGLKIVQWVPVVDHIKLELLKPEKLKLKVIRGIAEKAIVEFPPGKLLQLVRIGFIKLEKVSERRRRVRAIYVHD
ncbi:MAG: hypothetical protein QW630_03560, partial [Sulfolobales archaeon]